MNVDIKTQRLHFFLRVVPNPFSPGALFFGVQIFVAGLVTCRGRCSTGSLPVVRDMEENFSYVGLHIISADELGLWLKHPQAGDPASCLLAMPSGTQVQYVGTQNKCVRAVPAESSWQAELCWKLL